MEAGVFSSEVEHLQSHSAVAPPVLVLSWVSVEEVEEAAWEPENDFYYSRYWHSMLVGGVMVVFDPRFHS